MTFYHVKDWGGCDLTIDFKKLDLLPRITISEMTGCLVLNIGFLMLTFNLCIYSEDMREFCRKVKSEDFKKEAEQMAKDLQEKLEELKNKCKDVEQ